MKNLKTLVGRFGVTASFVLGAWGAWGALTTTLASAQQIDAIPVCKKNGAAFAVNNDTVLNWKKTTRNQYLDRGFISGVVSKVNPDRNVHDHFEVMIGKDQSESIEVIYNSEFGALPDIRIGMRVEACGDYITATAQSGPYPPSPAGAILHWVHMSPSDRHEDGFVRIDGKVYGNKFDGSPKKQPNKPKKPKKPGRPGVDLEQVSESVQDDAA